MFYVHFEKKAIKNYRETVIFRLAETQKFPKMYSKEKKTQRSAYNASTGKTLSTVSKSCLCS